MRASGSAGNASNRVTILIVMLRECAASVSKRRDQRKVHLPLQRLARFHLDHAHARMMTWGERPFNTELRAPPRGEKCPNALLHGLVAKQVSLLHAPPPVGMLVDR